MPIFEEDDQLSWVLQTANVGISALSNVVRCTRNSDVAPCRRDSVLKYSDRYQLVSQCSARDITKDRYASVLLVRSRPSPGTTTFMTHGVADCSKAFMIFKYQT